MRKTNNLKGLHIITIAIVVAFFVGTYTLSGNKLTNEIHNIPASSNSSSYKSAVMNSNPIDTETKTPTHQKKEKSTPPDSDSDTKPETDTELDSDNKHDTDSNPLTDTDSDISSDSDNTQPGTIFPYNGVWNLVVVNKDNPIPENYEFSVEEFENGKQVDSRILADLSEMFNDMRLQGIYPEVTEAYRTNEDQQAIMDEYIAGYIEQGFSDEQAREEAKKWVAKPGTSEHELGLALDINPDVNYLSSYDVHTWLAENAYKYGFILRYPLGKESITGIDYEPWHYRYVGRVAAEEIFNSGACLEEYLEE